MNKYQDAWDFVKDMQNDKYSNYSKEKEVIQELVDKATARKPIRDEMDFVYRCPTCNGMSIRTGCTDYYGIWLEIKFTHCSDCDQKIDWSNDE